MTFGVSYLCLSRHGAGSRLTLAACGGPSAPQYLNRARRMPGYCVMHFPRCQCNVAPRWGANVWVSIGMRGIRLDKGAFLVRAVLAHVCARLSLDFWSLCALTVLCCSCGWPWFVCAESVGVLPVPRLVSAAISCAGVRVRVCTRC